MTSQIASSPEVQGFLLGALLGEGTSGEAVASALVPEEARVCDEAAVARLGAAAAGERAATIERLTACLSRFPWAGRLHPSWVEEARALRPSAELRPELLRLAAGPVGVLAEADPPLGPTASRLLARPPAELEREVSAALPELRAALAAEGVVSVVAVAARLPRPLGLALLEGRSALLAAVYEWSG